MSCNPKAALAGKLLFTKGVFIMLAQLIFWSAIFIFCTIAEIISLGLTSIWFAGGALVAGILALFKVDYTIQVLVFALSSLVLLAVTRPFARKFLNQKKLAKTNVEGLIGGKALVISDIDNFNSKGQVKLNGLEWTARSVDDEVIPMGTEVEIVAISGVKAIVKKAN